MNATGRRVREQYADTGEFTDHVACSILTRPRPTGWEDLAHCVPAALVDECLDGHLDAPATPPGRERVRTLHPIALS